MKLYIALQGRASSIHSDPIPYQSLGTIRGEPDPEPFVGMLNLCSMYRKHFLELFFFFFFILTSLSRVGGR